MIPINRFLINHGLRAYIFFTIELPAFHQCSAERGFIYGMESFMMEVSK